MFDAPLEPGPSLLAAEALEAAVHAVLHHRNELLVTEQAVAVVVKDLKVEKEVAISRQSESFPEMLLI